MLNDGDKNLHNHNNEYAMQVLPAITVLAILMLVGSVGNSLVCYLYLFKFKRSTPRYFIVALAMFDLISCTISIPIEIVDLRFHYTFGSYTLCKVGTAFVSFSATASGTVLSAVAVDRYKKICRPFQSQTTPWMAKLAVLLCTVSAFVVSLPSVIMYGSRTVTTDDIHVNGSDCSTADQYMRTPYPVIYNAVQFVIFISATITLSVLYSLICREVCQQQDFRKGVMNLQGNHMSKLHISATVVIKDRTSDERSSTSDSFDAVECDVKMPSSAKPELFQTSNLLELQTNFSDNKPNQTSDKSENLKSMRHGDTYTTKTESKYKNRTRTRREENGVRRTTFMLFLITLVFVVSYFPHLALMAARAVNSYRSDGHPGAESPSYSFFLRSYFINSASNPIIYSIYNAKFRRETKLLFNKLTCRS